MGQSLVATAVGVQKITGIGVADRRDGKPYDTLAATEVNFRARESLHLWLFVSCDKTGYQTFDYFLACELFHQTFVY